MALEDGLWRAGFIYRSTFERCPFEVPSSPSGPDEHGFPVIAGLDLERGGDILAAVPGTRVLHVSYRNDNSSSSFSTRSSMASYSNQVDIYAELETDSSAAELVPVYRDGLKQPNWDILEEGSSGDFGWFSWTVLDGDGLLWYGNLVVAPLREGWKQVWLSVYSDVLDDNQ